ncbi:alpha/beta hydrolase [Candidatus Woesearchaeota archaeon]|nr:alpha/beta hydrolase [Candidatus Woesearchaeota archaeon]
MMHTEPIKVNDVTLEGFVFEPCLTSSRTTTIFVPGVSGHVKDYAAFLDAFAEDRRVITYNLRGHGKSEGTVEPDLLAQDLYTLLSSQKQAVTLLGQSFGAGIVAANLANPVVTRAYLLTPFLSPTSLNCMRRIALKALHALATHGMTSTLDDALMRGAPAFGIQFNNDAPLGAFGSLAAFEGHIPSEKPVAWMVANQDRMLGTTGAHYDAARAALRACYPNGRDDSALALGLNHCLNVRPNEYEPFCRDEPFKCREQIINVIRNFLIA